MTIFTHNKHLLKCIPPLINEWSYLISIVVNTPPQTIELYPASSIDKIAYILIAQLDTVLSLCVQQTPLVFFLYPCISLAVKIFNSLERTRQQLPILFVKQSATSIYNFYMQTTATFHFYNREFFFLTFHVFF